MTTDLKNNLHKPMSIAVPIFISFVIVVGAMFSGDAFAVDGNYSSPYATQWSDRSVRVSIPDETFVGMLLVIANLVVAGGYSIRDKLRRRHTVA